MLSLKQKKIGLEGDRHYDQRHLDIRRGVRLLLRRDVGGARAGVLGDEVKKQFPAVSTTENGTDKRSNRKVKV